MYAAFTQPVCKLNVFANTSYSAYSLNCRREYDYVCQVVLGSYDFANVLYCGSC